MFGASFSKKSAPNDFFGAGSGSKGAGFNRKGSGFDEKGSPFGQKGSPSGFFSLRDALSGTYDF